MKLNNLYMVLNPCGLFSFLFSLSLCDLPTAPELLVAILTLTNCSGQILLFLAFDNIKNVSLVPEI